MESPSARVPVTSALRDSVRRRYQPESRRINGIFISVMPAREGEDGRDDIDRTHA